MLLLAFAGVSFSAIAQQAPERQGGPEAKPNPKAALMAVKLKEIKEALNLSDTTMARFKPIYVRYDQELSRFHSERGKQLMLRADPDTLSTAQAEQALVAQINMGKAMIALQERYIAEFRAVLTPQQILKFFRVEQDIRRKALAEYRKRFPAKQD